MIHNDISLEEIVKSIKYVIIKTWSGNNSYPIRNR